MSPLLRRIGIVTAIVVGVMLLAGVAGYLVLGNSPVWGAIVLFSDESGAESFRSMHETFPSHTIPSDGETWAFSRDERPLPERYRFDGEARSLAAVLEDDETTGLLVAHATGTTASAFLEKAIWVPAAMGAPAARNTGFHGNELAHAFLGATPRDYARFGRLVLNDGRRDQRQVIPAARVNTSTQPSAPHVQPGDNPASTSTFGYGYQGWVPDEPEGDAVAIASAPTRPSVA